MSGFWTEVLLSAASAGSSCSLCGASASSAFLSSYIITHKKIALPAMYYLAGKVIVTAALCALSSVLGTAALDSAGLAGGADIYLWAQVLVLVISIFMMARWLCRRRNLPCARCADCGRTSECGEQGALALFASGVACGAAPCAPLMVVLAQSAAAPVGPAILLGVVFSAVGFLSPALLWLVISRLLAGKLRQELARQLPWFQFGCYVLLAGVTIYAIIRHIF